MYNVSLIGGMFRLNRAMLGLDEGEIGYVFNEYPDFYEPDKSGIQIIFHNGNYDGFSVAEQCQYLEYVGYKPEYQSYQFKNVMQVYQDWANGYWKWNDKETKNNLD